MRCKGKRIFSETDTVTCFIDQLVWLDYAGEDPSGISLVKETTDSDASYYSINGIQLTAPRNGVNIIKTAKGTRKVMVK